MSAARSWDKDKLLQELRVQYEHEEITTAWISEECAVQIALETIEGYLPEGRYSPKKVLGVGGSGIVLRLEDHKFPAVDKALKFPRPVDGRIAILREMLSKEIDHPEPVNRMRHFPFGDYCTRSSLWSFSPIGRCLPDC